MHGGTGKAEIHNEAFGSEPIFSSSILYFLELWDSLSYGKPSDELMRVSNTKTEVVIKRI